MTVGSGAIALKTKKGYEACDDGNEVRTDGCTDECVVARCGDGIVRDDLLAGVEGAELRRWQPCGQRRVQKRLPAGALR